MNRSTARLARASSSTARANLPILCSGTFVLFGMIATLAYIFISGRVAERSTVHATIWRKGKRTWELRTSRWLVCFRCSTATTSTLHARAASPTPNFPVPEPSARKWQTGHGESRKRKKAPTTRCSSCRWGSSWTTISCTLRRIQVRSNTFLFDDCVMAAPVCSQVTTSAARVPRQLITCASRWSLTTTTNLESATPSHAHSCRSTATATSVSRTATRQSWLSCAGPRSLHALF